MSDGGELRKMVSRWLDQMDARVRLHSGQRDVSKADVRAVVDVLLNHVHYKDWTIRDQGKGPPLTAADIAVKVGRNRNHVAAILAGLDHLGLTCLVQSHGGNDRTTIRQLNYAFGRHANASDGGVGEREPTQATVALENGRNESPTQATVAPNASDGGAQRKRRWHFPDHQKGEGTEGR